MNELITSKDRMFQRLANLVKEKFDTVITFTDFSIRLRIADAKATAVVQRNGNSNVIVMGNEVLLPIRSASNLFGYVTVFNGIALDERAIEQIREVTDLLLTETCLLEDKSYRLKILDHHLRTQNSFQDVIDLRDRLLHEEITHINPEISIQTESVDNVFPILVESHSVEEAKEFAFEIHRTSERSSFVTFENYLIDELHSVEAVQALGPVTLFIPNVRELPIDVQITLNEFLRSAARTTHHPRVIVGAQEVPEELMAVGVFDRYFFDKLSAARVKLPPKGTSTMALDEILTFFDNAAAGVPANSDTSGRHLYLVTPTEPSH